MVGILSSSGYNMDKKESQVIISERDNEDGQHNNYLHGDYDDDDDGDGDGDGDEEEDNGDVEFKPIEHSLEPPDDDQPAKCPVMPDLSFIKVYGIWKEPLTTEIPQKRADEVDPKRPCDNAQDPALQFKGPQYNIFGVFQQCKEFGFS